MHPLMLPVTFETLRFAAVMVLGFVLALFLGARFLPGLERTGYPQPDGSRKEYSLTGMTLFFMTHIALGVATFGFGVTLTPIVTHFWSICIVANVLAVIVSLVLYARAQARGRRGKGVLKYPHPQGNRLPETVQDLWFGAELNPTWLGVDMKMFLYQPSLIGVYLIVLSFGYAQHDTYGVLTPQMICLVVFWFAYLFTHYVKEEFMLSTWDVISENFGFMLVWGDLVYVPFLYSLPGWWLITPKEPFSTLHSVALGAFFLLALWIFREANWQKERFKRDNGIAIWGKPAETIGGRLLVSGWWGIARKVNYAGELGVYLAFAMTTGGGSILPYVLPLSLTVLLVQRAGRDDKKCRAKYGEVWARYCERVRFRIFPFVY
jgi:Delta14-sterol reductase